MKAPIGIKHQKPTDRKGGKWGIYQKGKWSTFSTWEAADAESRRIAWERLRKKAAAQTAGGNTDQRGVLIEVCDRYLTNLQASNRRPAYIKKHRRYLGKLTALKIKDVPIDSVDQVTAQQVETVLASMVGKTHDADAFCRTVKIFLKWCRDVGGYRIDERVLKIKNPAVDEKQQRLLSDKEVQTLLDGAKSIYVNHLMIDFLKAFGTRPAEFVDLEDKHLNFETGVLTVQGTLAKTRRPRVFPIGAAWVAKIKEGQKKRIEGCVKLFVNDWGYPWNWTYVRDVIRRIAEEKKMGRVNPYLLRHYAACKVFEKSKDPKMTETIIGHDWQTSMRYYQHRDNDAISKLTELL